MTPTNPPQIDVWDVGSYDASLIARLKANESLVKDYIITDRRLDAEREASRHRLAYGQNPHGEAYQAFVEEIGREMASRTIRAWHFTRLLDSEVESIRTRGIHISTAASHQLRLDAAVKGGHFTADVVKQLLAESPLRDKEQLASRTGKFWMSSDPIAPDDSGVELLLGNWGGEVTYFWLKNQKLKSVVAKMGRARVLELAIPLAVTPDAYKAGRGVVSAFTRSLGLRPPNRGGFDLYSVKDLPPDVVLAIHSEGEPKFQAMARGYPEGFVEAE